MQAQIHYVEGSGLPLVYIPGVDGTGNYLLGTAERLAERFRLVGLRYELERSMPREGDSYEGLARSVAERLDEVGFERGLVVTESFGGAVSLQLALDHPDRVAGLLIVNSFAFYPWRSRLLLSRATAPLCPRWLLRLLRPYCVPPALIRPRRDPEAERRFLDSPPAFFDEGYRRRLRLIRKLDLRPRLSEVRQPVALFASDHDRIVDSVPAARAMHAELPDSRLEIVEGAGHLTLPLGAEPWLERLLELAERAGY
jgi:pimeloyl-ACP methyl ester carboxylesterase